MSVDTLKLCGLVVLLAPLAGAILAGVFAPLLRGRAHWPVIVGVGAALIAAIFIFFEISHAPISKTSISIPIYDWITDGASSSFKVDFLFDPLTAVMLMTVTGISLLVVIYSRDYMRDHGHPQRGYERFFAFLGLFVFAMCALVLGGNFLLLYLGWEAVGLCSYLLIGFYYGKPAAAAAAKKAFLVNRVGDFGFGLGILLIYLSFRTLDYHAVFSLVDQGLLASGQPIPNSLMTAIALLLLCGACGKSAQFPLHVWLPDAMEGPSPVSALIHAATMVTAGVYMVARCGAIFTASETAMTVIAVLGALTALFAATIALVQTDVKRILAYSTISQLGFMFLALGVFAADSAVFHLFTHAFFKALLFLGAGSVMHAMGGVIDLRHFCGLRRVLPWTYATFLIGSLALAGFPMFSGFFSKDEIIHHALIAHPLLGGMALFTAALTAFYTFRMVFLVFHGSPRVPQGVHAHEAGGWMLAPLFVLSIGAAAAGYVGVNATGRFFHHFLSPVFSNTFAAPHLTTHASHATFWSGYGLMILSGGLSIAAIGTAYLVYVRQPWISGLFKNTATGVYRLLWKKYYVDELYELLIVCPAGQTARFCVGIDDYFVDGLVWVISAIPRAVAYFLRTLQSGLLQSYALSMVAGVVLLLLLVL